MTHHDLVVLVVAILDVPWTVLAGLLWWKPSRATGSDPQLRYAVYAAPVVLTLTALFGAAA